MRRLFASTRVRNCHDTLLIAFCFSRFRRHAHVNQLGVFESRRGGVKRVIPRAMGLVVYGAVSVGSWLVTHCHTQAHRLVFVTHNARSSA